MADETKHTLQASDLPVVQYLNQRITFDLLATIEDGFSHFTTIETQSSESSSVKRTGEAGVKTDLGIGSIITLFRLNLSGKRSSGTDESQREVKSGELVHTPTSLFARLRNELYSRRLVRKVSTSEDISEINEGNFVEFEATLHRNQIIEVLDTFEVLMPLITAFGEDSNSGSANKRKSRRGKDRQTNDNQKNPTLVQVESLRKAIVSSGTIDLVARVGKMNFVLTAEDDCFIEPTMNSVLDGNFRVFGKVTRVVIDNTESVNLLRSSPFGKFPQAVQQLGSAIQELRESGFEGGVPETNISGPTLQVIPIAIFS